MIVGAIACVSVARAEGEGADRLRKGFDLLSDGDDSLSDSASSTLEELKSIGSSLGASSAGASGGNSTSPRGAGLGVVSLGSGRGDSGASSLGIVGGSEAAPLGIFIPFGKSVPTLPGVKHYTATGHQECKACQQIITTMYLTGPMFPDLTWGLPPEYKEMGQAQQAVLQACPEFMNNWCYEDLGGTQMLRSPCPAYLTCHYCLGLNPLHCLPDDLSDKVTFYR